LTDREYRARLRTIEGLEELIEQFHPRINEKDKFFMMEFALHGVAEYSLISKKAVDTGIVFKDLLDSMFDPNKMKFDDDDDDFKKY
jgi:magnesium chelatase subunit I